MYYGDIGYHVLKELLYYSYILTGCSVVFVKVEKKQ